MRRLFVAGNWKMNMTMASSQSLARAVMEGMPKDASVEVAVFPPTIYLTAVGWAIRGGQLGLGAQNVYHEPPGAFTGETAVVLADLGPGEIGPAELRGSPWRARNLGEDTLPAGARCRVERIDGLLLEVRGETQPSRSAS